MVDKPGLVYCLILGPATPQIYPFLLPDLQQVKNTQINHLIVKNQKKITIESDWMTLKSSGRGSSRTSNAKSVKRFTSKKKAPNIQKDAYRLSLYN